MACISILNGSRSNHKCAHVMLNMGKVQSVISYYCALHIQKCGYQECCVPSWQPARYDSDEAAAFSAAFLLLRHFNM